MRVFVRTCSVHALGASSWAATSHCTNSVCVYLVCARVLACVRVCACDCVLVIMLTACAFEHGLVCLRACACARVLACVRVCACACVLVIMLTARVRRSY